MKRIVSIINHKGGVGKTTSAVNIGAGLHQLGKKILLVDMDPQANLTINFGIDPQEQEKTIYTALAGKCSLPIIRKDNAPDIVPANLDLSVAEIELNNEPGRESILKSLLLSICSDYDYVLIDCPPSLGFLTLNALSASHSAIIPVELSTFSLVGMTRLFDVIKKVSNRINPELQDYNILVVRTDKRQSVQRELSVYLGEKYATHMIPVEIRQSVKILESQVRQTDIFSYAPNSRTAIDYMNVCEFLLQITRQTSLLWQNQK
ncbi:MAG: AAA family ATPase [Dysgonamonadaceae bacterium]|jgi:chromosome partitioning protein|nr:AAA family ATPase [Dysgonamonadaceae bacterium]